MKVLLSIKPEFAEKLLSGEKCYEYRKVIFKEDVDTILVYACKPVGRILGELKIERILVERPERLWNMTKQKAGISKAFFLSYFEGRSKAYAIEVASRKRYKCPIDPYAGDSGFVPPQSFRYVYSNLY